MTFAIQCGAASLAFYLIYHDYVAVFFVLSFAAVTAIVIYPTYFIMNHINDRRYLHSIKYGNQYTLSERFQLSENIRTKKIVKVVVNACIWCNLIIFAEVYCLQSVKEVRAKFAMKMVYESTVTLYGMIVSTSTVLL
uniref:Serpentine receptor class gamma n=1 Tax=Panagrellus redivivus TaxID=6233 RepID=A0A7E4UNY0_PANRE